MHNPLSTVTEDVDSVFEIRIACTSTNRNHNSVLMCDNIVIDFFLKLHSANTIYSTNYLRCVESYFPSVSIIIKQLLKMMLMFSVKILI